MTKKPYFRLSIISCLLISCYVKAETQSIKDTKEAISSEVGTQSTEDSELETISVTAEKIRDRKDNEVTGLGKIIKTSESISREQVLNIRDLTRYDPGISVVEQGRGASSGYSIRGMDRNRVALLVDGLPQTQSYVVQSPLVARSGYSGTGAINEIEYENVKAVEISKGGSSSEYGNGALAGSVTFQSKSAADILEGDKSWGIQTKNAYSSKNKGFTHSLAVAGKQGGFEGLAIYTQRNSIETQVHKDALKGVQSYERFIATTDGSAAHFVMQDECPKGYDECKTSPKRPAKLSSQRETVSVSDYTGANRIKPNPMKYESQSWFLRGGYHFSEQHYIGGIFEFTQQKFDIRDMTFPAYLRSTEDKDFESRPFYPKQDYGAYQHIRDGRGVKYASGLYFDEHHRKQRVGIEYIYENKNKAGIIDKAVLSANQQNIILDSYMQHTHCSLYPNPSKNCRPTLDKPYSYYHSDRNVYKEKHNMLQLNLEKKIQQNWLTHQIVFNLGFDDFTSALQHKDYLTRRVTATANSIPGKPGEKRNGYDSHPYFYPKPKAELVGGDLCDYKGNSSNYRDCKVRLIKGKNYYFAARNNMALGKYVDLGLGMRYDVSRTKANESTISVGKFKNFSWNTGIVIKPTEWLDLSYRLSTGFRNPSFAEMYGWRYGGNNSEVYVGKFKPETSRNQEFGLALKGDFGNIEISHFSNAYRNLIAFAEELKNGRGKGNYGYHNAQNAKLVGVNITAQLDFNGLWKRIPYGWYATFAYNRVKVKDQKINTGLASVSSYLFDAIQPSRYIIGLGYDHPSNTWGINTMFTQSKAKSQNELLGQRALGSNSRNVKSTRKLTRAWHILDVSGYYMVNRSILFRLGVYNLLNYRYVTWEAVRQTAQGAVNQHQNVGNYTRYAASGRNYTLTLEMKF
ncbi:transferrin-binding protein 1 [Haemophilus influenzae]|uniref:lactoferrin/transferrin family TonB-dependent receptor n=1 Tax=Haemophilus influenzae TaxID=727 RepID=UPI000766AE65|nr:lactoferrin/transferrin family TonB-dependent receptor [Haemophilus influenzae]AWP55303.1 lactoferrin/transferrin family TonB-dependent receptor [Haemophilus influenzae]MCK8941959.1 lactoferrin/transferrin family TonB-dependent receptor [Haemophilus influenzae]MCK8947550.1 lactoferrin/transferrin family TonB-dependent receptor [Haemophilus influenzae]PRI75096.1 Transferrin-binding protein 1 precursor [Haemophilus influenzae]PRJ96350.1 Transferrin-binding protein 1 precursor [Haemophilus inf